MKVLLDENVDPVLGTLLVGHEVVHVSQVGLRGMVNGLLIRTAEDLGFDVLVTADRQMRFQQSLANRRIRVAVLVFRGAQRQVFPAFADVLLAELPSLEVGAFTVLHLPDANPTE